ncbi:MAG: nitroreductase/quinone reductase family protein [Halobacteriales archaeon]|nr:nitroreductase/quinone reductase family protein [Halobacteriales archaeon]
MSDPAAVQAVSDTEEPPVTTRTPPGWLKPAFTVINPLMRALLRSPLHGLVSDSLLLITFTGRKSGQEYTTPVGYDEVDGTLYVTSQIDRVWWKNLRGGADVSVRLQGEERAGHASVIEDDEQVADYVLGYLERHGIGAAGRLALSFRDDEVPDRETLASCLEDVAVIEIELADADA